jgi:hypothetical protein
MRDLVWANAQAAALAEAEREDIAARVVMAPCKVCRAPWPHPSVLSTSPVCEACRRKVEVEVNRLRARVAADDDLDF